MSKRAAQDFLPAGKNGINYSLRRYDYHHHNNGELDDECEFFFKDHFDLINNIKKACDAVHQCYEYGKFEKGWPLVEKLLNLEVKVKGSLASYHGVQSLFFKDFSQYQLVPQRAISEVTYAVVPFIYFNFDEVDRILVIVSLLLQSGAPEFPLP